MPAPPPPTANEQLGLQKSWHGTLFAANRIFKYQQQSKKRRFAIDTVRSVHRIEHNGDQEVVIDHVVGISKGVNVAGFFSEGFGVEDDAPAVEFLDDLGLQIEDLSTPRRDVAYLQTVNSGRYKECAIFFIPEIASPRDRRRIVVHYKWPRGAARLVTLGTEEWSFPIASGNRQIKRVEIVFDFSPKLGDVRCVRTGQLTGTRKGAVKSRRLANGYLRWRYVIPRAESGEVYALKFELPKRPRARRLSAGRRLRISPA